MERFNDNLVLTTSQVAELLSVHPSTVKRWCNDGDLDSDKTDGGHRRIHLEDVLRVAQERDVRTFLDGFDPYQAHVWSAVTEIRDGNGFGRAHALAMGWLSRGYPGRVGRLFEALGALPDVPFTHFLDEGVRGFMSEVGRAWREGRLRVGEEHLASQTLVEALLRLRSRFHVQEPEEAARGNGSPPGGVAVVGAMEGDQHHLGALCVRLLLEREGWRILYLGPDVPVEDFAHIQRAHGADLVCVSFSPPATEADMSRCMRILGGLYARSHPYSLALGGSIGLGAALPEREGPFEEIRIFESTERLLAALHGGFGQPVARRADGTMAKSG